MQSKSPQISPNSFQHTIKLPASRTTFANHAYIYIWVWKLENPFIHCFVLIHLVFFLQRGTQLFSLCFLLGPRCPSAILFSPSALPVCRLLQGSSSGSFVPFVGIPFFEVFLLLFFRLLFCWGVYALFPPPLFQLIPGVGRHVGTCKAFWWRTAKSCHIKIVVSKSCTILGT